MTETGTYVGIDVAKANIDIAVRPTGRVWPASYDAAGIEELVAQLEDLAPTAVLLEATGGLEVPLAAALAAAALPVVVVNPRQVRDFAKATGQLAKTDALDAQVLAHFAEAVRPPIRPLRDADTQELNALTTRRNQMMTMLVAEKNRSGRATGVVRPNIEADISWLEQGLKDLDKGLRQLLRQSPVWREKDDLLRSVPGVGEQLSLSLLAYLPELGALDRKQIAALVGVAPHEPGQRNRRRKTYRLGREGACQGRALHGRIVGHPVQLGDTNLLPTVAGGGQAEAAGAHCVYAEVAYHAQRHRENRPALGSTRRHALTSTTVAIGCSWSGDGLVFHKPLSQNTGALSYPFSTPPHSSLRWIGAKGIPIQRD